MKKVSAFIAALAVAAAVNAQNYKQVYDGDLATGDNWRSNEEIILNGVVRVPAGATLTIQPGCVVRGLPESGKNVSALVVQPGGKIIANGTKEQPIIFTALTDNMADPCDLGPSARGLWGGVFICGNAIVDEGTNYVEGLPPEYSQTYGGTDDSDSSGVIRYVSIRHTGIVHAHDIYIHGLNLHGVGSRTVVEHVEVMSSGKDGFAMFGGSVNLKWCAVGFCGDDSFDWDKGWRGKGQFWFSIHNGFADVNSFGDHGAEMDGLTNPSLTRYSDPTIFNATIIGHGSTGVTIPPKWVSNGHGQRALRFREGTAAEWSNSIFMSFPNYAIEIANSSSFPVDAYDHMLAGDLSINNSIFYDFGKGNTWDAIIKHTDPTERAAIAAHLSATCQIANPGLRSISREKEDPALDPRPSNGSLAMTMPRKAKPTDAFFSTADYIGAFDPAVAPWLSGWTAFDHMHILQRMVTIAPRNGHYISNTSIDLAFNVPLTNHGISAYQIKINNSDVSAAFTARKVEHSLAKGGRVYRVPGVRLWEIGGPGKHTITATFDLGVHGIVRDTAIVRIY